MSNDIDKFLFGGGGKAAKFEKLGDMVSGVVSDVSLSQQTSMEDNTPLTWADGSPRMQLVIRLQTEDRDGDEDDGVRTIYAKGGTYKVAEGKGSALKNAIADAVKKAGASTISEGGKLTVGFTGLGEKTNRGYSAPKLFTAKYEAPVSNVATADLFDD